MRQKVLLDTGPLVALLNRRDRRHDWARARFADLEPPLLTCEAVLVEACHLLREHPGGARAVLDFLHRGAIEARFSLQAEVARVEALLARFADLPMSLADACLVRMAEIYPGSAVLTLDSDFRVYRMHGRRVIPTLLPSAV